MSIAIKSARARTQGGQPGAYAAGDPGLFGWLGKGLKTAAGFLPGGSAIQAGIDAVTSGRGRGRGGGQMMAARPGTGVSRPEQPSRAIRYAQAAVPGGRTGQETVTIACPSGYRPNKTGYHLKDGSYIEKGTRCVKIRRRNPMNARALNRSISRINGGKRFQNILRGIETERFTKAGTKK